MENSEDDESTLMERYIALSVDDQDLKRRIAHLKSCQNLIVKVPFEDLRAWSQVHLTEAYNATTMKPMAYDNQVLRGRLWIGDVDDSHPRNLAEKQIKAVVSLVENLKVLRPVDCGVAYYRVVIPDDPSANLATYFDPVTDFIHANLQQGNRVLVHCMAGVSRSASIVIAYLMRYMGMTHLQAYMALAAVRPIVCPNFGFFAQLRLYEAKLSGK